MKLSSGVQSDLTAQLAHLVTWGFVGKIEGGLIKLTCTACNACFVQGVPTHESRCPNAMRECAGCNAVIPTRKRYCHDCNPARGL